MTNKKKSVDTSPAKHSNVPVGVPRDDPDKKKAVAGIATSPMFNAAVAESAYIGGKVLGVSLSAADIHSALVARFKPVVRENDMSSVETMLLAQAHTCDVIFNDFALRAKSSETMPRLEAYMRLALKAQQQSAATLRVLGEMKNPRPVAFIKQQNNAAGHQQVNNGTAPPESRAHEKSADPSNELLEHRNGEWLDTGAASEAGRGNQAMETVGAVHRAEDSRG